MKKIVIVIIFLFFIFIGYVCCELYIHKKRIDNSISKVEPCYFQDTAIHSIKEDIAPGKNGCYEKMFDLILPRLLVYDVKYHNYPYLTYNKIDDKFTVPEELIKSSDAILSWGLGPNYDFEKVIAAIYKTPIYAFDCGFPDEEIAQMKKHRRYKDLTIQRECIGNDKYIIYGEVSNHKIHTFGQKLKELNLENKKIYIKLGIPEVHEYMDDILKYKDNIMGISIAIDFWSPRYIVKLFYVLDELNKNFILVSRKSNHVFNYRDKIWTSTMTLIYINKHLAKDYHISWKQNNNESDTKFLIIGENGEDSYTKKSIDYFDVLYWKIKELKNELKNRIRKI